MTTTWNTNDAPSTDEDVEQCADCNQPIAEAEVTYHEGSAYCPDCMDGCEECNALLPSASLDEGLCPECRDTHRRCYECAGRCHVDRLTLTDGDEDVCPSCLERLYVFCHDCDVFEHYDNRCSEDGGVESYSYKPDPCFYETAHEDVSDTSPYFGVELEIEAVHAEIAEGVELIGSHLGDLAYCKADGSLRDGFELVTHPMTLDFVHEQDWRVLSLLANSGFRSWKTSTCGIHVHVSRAGFKGRAHVWRFCHLFYRNAEEWQRFAGRSGSSWARFDGQRPKVAKVLKAEEYPERYVAVNLCNTDTVEIRIFRGTLRAKRMVADVEGVAAALAYTRDLTVPEVRAGALGWPTFTSYLSEQARTYPSLVAVLAEGRN